MRRTLMHVVLPGNDTLTGAEGRGGGKGAGEQLPGGGEAAARLLIACAWCAGCSGDHDGV